MRAIIFLLRRSIVNSLLQLRHQPGKLVLYLVLVAIMAGTVTLSLVQPNDPGEALPFAVLPLALFGFVTIFAITALAQGLSKGSEIFSMSDANLAFTAPISPRRILIYGIVRMLKTAFLSSFFILFYAPLLARMGVDFSGLLLIFASFLFAMLTMTIISLVVYTHTNGRPRRKIAVRIGTVALFIPLVVAAAWHYASNRDPMALMDWVITSWTFQFVPVIGWTTTGTTELVQGHLAVGLGFLGLNLLASVILVVYLMATTPDYYEDVLVGTELAFQRRLAIAEGDINSATVSGRSYRVGRTGLIGHGAAAIFGRHLREARRESILGLLTPMSLGVIIGGVVVAVIIGDLFSVVPILAWAQLFLVGTGRGWKDTYIHYLYLIPESSFRKIIWSNIEVVVRTLIEALALFGVAGAILGTPLLEIMAYIVVYSLFSFLLLGINYLSMRFTGANLSNGLLLMIYILAVIVVMTPGIIAGVLVSLQLGGQTGVIAGLLVVAAWELLAGIACFAAAQGVLHSCDMAMMKPSK